MSSNDDMLEFAINYLEEAEKEVLYRKGLVEGMLNREPSKDMRDIYANHLWWNQPNTKWDRKKYDEVN